MTADEPAAAIQGTKVGAICDRCNRRLRSGDSARFYATVYPESGWALRRVYCSNCGESSIEASTADADEVVGEAVWFNHMLAAVRITDRSRPQDGDSK